jgi:hypothetical protein
LSIVAGTLNMSRRSYSGRARHALAALAEVHYSKECGRRIARDIDRSSAVGSFCAAHDGFHHDLVNEFRRYENALTPYRHGRGPCPPTDRSGIRQRCREFRLSDVLQSVTSTHHFIRWLRVTSGEYMYMYSCSRFYLHVTGQLLQTYRRYSYLRFCRNIHIRPRAWSHLVSMD